MTTPIDAFNPANLASTVHQKRNEWNDITNLGHKQLILQDAFTANQVDLGLEIVPFTEGFETHVSAEGVIVVADAPIDQAANEVLNIVTNGSKRQSDIFQSNYKNLVKKETPQQLSISRDLSFTHRDQGVASGPPVVIHKFSR